ncbi:MAG TPA: alpha/beta hydrolase [Stellaceae bacterium]|jgi:pimeloyl-ACP methyl ester carboxylesterase|nr:alpha/beta hydrolase [Stellaceae bacterium]
MTDLKHGFVHTNGIRMHYAEAGSGPLMVLCHGWPESWYSWRHQIPALAEAGFRAVAPDQRGYGQTDRPDAIAAYTILELVGDIVGLVKALGETSAIVVGHDWGALVAQQCALLRPDLFRALALLSVPFIPRGPVRPAVRFAQITQQTHFYQEYFQQPGRVERELEEDVRGTMLGLLAEGGLATGASPAYSIAAFPKNMRLGDVVRARLPDRLPPWLTEVDLDFYVGEFTRVGFRGGINWYRNIDRNWELTPFQDGATLMQPAVFIAGEHDLVLKMTADILKLQDTLLPRLKGTHLVPDAGHWVQQQRPKEVNDLLVGFLRGL